MGAEHEVHMISREMTTESPVVFSCTSISTAVTNLVMTAVAYLLVQYELSMN